MAHQKNEEFVPWMLLLRTQRVVLDQLSKAMQQENQLPLTWFDVLAQLELAGGRLRMTELADSVLLSASGLTRLLDRMEVEGLLSRSHCQDDRRGYWAELTKKGRRKVSTVLPAHIAKIRRHFLDHLDKEEVLQLQEILTKVLEAEDSERALRRLLRR